MKERFAVCEAAVDNIDMGMVQISEVGLSSIQISCKSGIDTGR
jgi:hypothetical protein